MCCRMMGVAELAKLPGVWCTHARKRDGCAIYEERPGSCRSFSCVWLASTIAPDELRPDKIHGVVASTPDGVHLVVHADPAWPEFAHRAMRPFLNHWIKDGTRYYIVLTGKKGMFFGDPKWLPAATEMMNAILEPT
jgi:hypothetical protein